MFNIVFPQMLLALGVTMKNIFVRTNSDFIYEVDVIRYIPGLEDGFIDINGELMPYVSTVEGNKIPNSKSFITVDEVGNKDVLSPSELYANFRPRKMDE